MTNESASDADLTYPTEPDQMVAAKRGKQFEKNRREHWSKQPYVLDVFRDTYGPTDLAVVFNRKKKVANKVLLVQAKLSGRLEVKDRSMLEKLVVGKPEQVEVRVEFVEDLDKSLGNANTSYTSIKTVDHLDCHTEKIAKLQKRRVPPLRPSPSPLVLDTPGQLETTPMYEPLSYTLQGSMMRKRS